MKKTTAYHIRNILIAAGCVATSGIVGLLVALWADSETGGLVVALVVMVLYGVFRYLFQVLGAWLYCLPVACVLLVMTGVALVEGEWVAAACSGAFSLLAVRHLFSQLQDSREAVRVADEWEYSYGEPEVHPCTVSTQQLIANLRDLAASNPEATFLNDAATCLECRGKEGDYALLRRFILSRKGDDWCACFADFDTHPDRACVPWLAARRLFIRETGDTEPAIMEAGDTPVHGIVFHHNGELRIYPSPLAGEFMETWGKALLKG